jgi:hypothetical protein
MSIGISLSIPTNERTNRIMDCHDMDNEGVKDLADGLRINVTLLKISLTNIRVDIHGARDLAPCFGHDSILTELNLYGNNIGDEEMK